MVASLLPRAVEVTVEDELRGFTDNELAAFLAEAGAQLRAMGESALVINGAPQRLEYDDRAE
jgi:hypothetical protein